MRWNPILNASGAALYIVGIVTFMQFMEALFHDKPDTITAPLLALSLFVFSAAVMAFLFFYRPIVLLIDNKKEEALTYFLKTLGIFAITMLFVVVFVSLCSKVFCESV